MGSFAETAFGMARGMEGSIRKLSGKTALTSGTRPAPTQTSASVGIAPTPQALKTNSPGWNQGRKLNGSTTMLVAVAGIAIVIFLLVEYT
jgi:hypothetical protein